MPKLNLTSTFALIALCFSLAVTGCDSGASDDDSPSIGGMYTDTATSQGVTATMTLDIEDTTGGSVSLTGSLAIQSGAQTVTQALEGTGTYDFPDLSLNVTTEIDGEMESDQLTGTVSSSGDILTLRDSEGVEFTLTRE